MFGSSINLDEVTVWITADLHFEHKNIIKFCPRTRPFPSVEVMDEMLIEEWNHKVKPEDIIIHVGDFCFKGVEKTTKYLARLNGKKIFLLGNHDKILRNNIVVGTYGIIWIGEYLELSVNKQKICFSHYPITCWNQAQRGSLMLFGHCHGSYCTEGTRTIDVGYDNLGAIVKLEQIRDQLNKEPIVTKDGH